MTNYQNVERCNEATTADKFYNRPQLHLKALVAQNGKNLNLTIFFVNDLTVVQYCLAPLFLAKYSVSKVSKFNKN